MENRVCALHGSPRSASLVEAQHAATAGACVGANSRIIIIRGSSDPIAEEPLSRSCLSRQEELVSSGGAS